MKRTFAIILTLALCLSLLPTHLPARAETYDYLTYTISDGQVTITNCDEAATGELVIPDTIEGYPVTRIGSSAFFNCTHLTRIIIPDSVTSIESWAISYCSHLTELTIPDSVTSIGRDAFAENTRLAKVTLSNSITSIPDSAFFRCYNLTDITIPDSVTSIGAGAFYCCLKLTEIIIPRGVTHLGSGAFGNPSTSYFLSDIRFLGNAPNFGTDIFGNNSTTVWYHSGTDGWTDVTPSSLGKKITIQKVNHICREYAYDNNHTCTVDGTERAVCLACGETDIRSVKGSAAHRFVYTANNDATCTQDGTKTGTCRLCSITETVTEEGTALGHDYSDYTSNNDATCTTDGSKSAICANCGHIDTVTEEGTAGGHSYSEYTSNNDATCTADGTKSAVCATCGHIDTVTATGSALGHSFTNYISDNNYTCTLDGSETAKCDRCDSTHRRVEVGTKAHRYVDGSCLFCGQPEAIQPTLDPKYPTLTFEDMITMNIYFQAENLEDVVEMGLITYKSEAAQWSIDTAEAVIPGYYQASGLYVASTEGIPAKDMGDTYWFAVYAKLNNGTYAYSRLISYSPVHYAIGQLGDPEMAPLVVAMLNYGAAAQTYFNYKTDSLMNSSLTTDQLASIESYRADMVAPLSTPSDAKAANFTKTPTGFSKWYPTITFEGAFSINYFCQPSYTPVGNMTLYYWDQNAYDACDVLSVDNATGTMTMENSDDLYSATLEGIAAKDLDQGIYVAFVYSDGTSTYRSGILAYSIGIYCNRLASGTDSMAPFAAATAVYGYYAKQMFG